MSPDTLTTEEAAALLDVRPVTIRSYVMRGILVGEKRGRDWFFPRAAVERLRADRPRRTGRPRTRVDK